MTVKRGSDNIRSRLTEQDVLDIYNSSDMTQKALADKYGISQSAVNHILKGKTWGWLTKHAQ